MKLVTAQLLGVVVALVLWFSAEWVYRRLTDKFWARRHLLAKVSTEYLTWIYLGHIALIVKGYQLKRGQVRSTKEHRPALRVKARFADKTQKVVDVEVNVYDVSLLDSVQPYLDDVTETVKALGGIAELELRPTVVLA